MNNTIIKLGKYISRLYWRNNCKNSACGPTLFIEIVYNFIGSMKTEIYEPLLLSNSVALKYIDLQLF